MKKIYLFVWLIAACSYLQAQTGLVYNEGALVYARPNAIIKIKGTMVNDPGSDFTNHGITTIDSSYINNALTQGNGTYNVGLHWENNSVFIADTSEVILNGDNQLITGDSVSAFYDLELTNTGIKTQTLHSYTTHLLKLNDRELATDSFYMYVTNPALTAITRTTGFVSSVAMGRLVRTTNSTGLYLFPTGSSLGTLRYRPVRMQPSAAAINQYGVRLANNNATLDGMDVTVKDSAVCEVNPLYYHYVEKISGTDDASFSVFYDAATDGSWDGLAYWDHLTTLMWEDAGPISYGSLGGFQYNTKTNWNQWQYIPVALSKRRPPIPYITGDTVVCGGYTTQFTGTSTQGITNFVWNVSNGGLVLDSTANPASVVWGIGNTNDTLQLVQIAANGCVSYPASMYIYVTPQPVAAFGATPLTALGSIPIVYTDSSQNAAYWNWYFGDGGQSSETNPSHVFNAQGNYTTMLVIETAEGCLDTAYLDLTIIDGLIIPNVFTPNGDGLNDIFEIAGTNFKNFEAAIFDRWGVMVFESSAAQVSWNGKTLTDSWASEGTYFLSLDITLLNGEVVHYGGFLNLFY